MESILGQRSQGATMELEVELKRIVGDYQRQQLQRARKDQVENGHITLDQGEVLVSLNEVSFSQTGDRLEAKLKITTGDSSTYEIQIPV